MNRTKAKKNAEKPVFHCVSEWVRAGGPATKYQLFLTIDEIRIQSFSVKCKKIDGKGKSKITVCWFPKSVCIRVVNDVYDYKRHSDCYLIPDWVLYQRDKDGYRF